MKILEVMNNPVTDSCELRKGVKLHTHVDSNHPHVHLGDPQFGLHIYLHRTEPHVNRLTKHVRQRLEEAHPVFRVKTCQLELGSDVLRDDPARAIVIIRRSSPICWSVEQLVNDDPAYFNMLSRYREAALAAPVLIAESAPYDQGTTVRDTIWIVRTGQGIQVNLDQTVAYEDGALTIHRNVDWKNEVRMRAVNFDEVWA